MRDTPVFVVILFHKKDIDYKEAIVKHLEVLNNQEKICCWDEELVLAGENPQQMLREKLDEAEIVLFLVSIDSIGSKDGWNKELTDSINRHDQKQLVLIPVLVRDCQWKDAPLGGIKPLPVSCKPMSTWVGLDEPCTEVANAVKEHVIRISRKKRNVNKLWDHIPSEFREITAIFQAMPDNKVTNHISFMDQEGKPASAAHFAVYAQMLQEIGLRMGEREAYNFYVGNLNDAREIEEIGKAIGERAQLLKIDTILLKQIAQELEDASRNFRLNFASPEYAKSKNWQIAKVKFVNPFCEAILKIEKKLGNLSKFFSNIDFSNLSPN